MPWGYLGGFQGERLPKSATITLPTAPCPFYIAVHYQLKLGEKSNSFAIFILDDFIFDHNRKFDFGI